MQNIVAIQY